MATKQVRFFRATAPGEAMLPGGFPTEDIVQILGERLRDGTSEVNFGVGTRLIARTIGTGANGTHIALYQIRGDQLPVLYENGRFRPLEEVLNEGAEIAEVSYFAIFPNDVLSMIYNHLGPKQRHLSSYLASVSTLDVSFEMITRPDLIESIEHAGGVRILNLAVRLEDIGQMAGMGLRGIRTIAQDVPSGEVELIVRARTIDQRRNLGRFLQRLAPEITQRGPHGPFRKAQAILTDTDALTEGRAIDLLEDHLVLSEDVDTIAGHRNFLDEASAMAALENAFLAVEARLA